MRERPNLYKLFKNIICNIYIIKDLIQLSIVLLKPLIAQNHIYISCIHKSLKVLEYSILIIYTKIITKILESTFFFQK